MNLGSMEERTEGIKKQAQQLIEQAYQRGFKAGREDRQEWEKDQADRLIEQGRNEAWEAARKIGNNSWTSLAYQIGFENLDSSINASWDCVMKYTASEAIERIRAYEEQKKQEETEKIEHLINFCKTASCLGCVLDTSDFKCGRGSSWHANAASCGDIDKAYELVTEYENKQKEDSEIHVGDVIRNYDVEAVVTWCNGKDWNGFLLKGEGAGEVGQVYSCMSCNDWKKTGRTFPQISEVLKKMQEGE